MTWLDAAALGRPITTGSSPVEIGSDLNKIFADLRDWGRQWLHWQDAAIGFSGSTTHAIDLCLLAVPRLPRRILVTSMAHPTVLASVSKMAAWYSRFSSTPVSVGTVDIDLIDLQTPAGFVDQLLLRIENMGPLDESVVVLEHVSSLHGIRAPVERIANSLHERGVLRTVVDGAQAIGVWRPLDRIHANYAGCFHKYVAGPPGTAFFAIDGADDEILPHHADLSYGPLPTIPVSLWRECREVLMHNCPVEHAADRIAHAEECTDALDTGLHPYSTSLASVCDTAMRSHVHAIDCGTPELSGAIARKLARKSIHVGVHGRWLRVSWSFLATVDEVGRAGSAISLELSRNSVEY